MPPATPFAAGREADLYDIDAHRVLRRYRHGGDTAPEAATMRYAAAQGFPVPAVLQARGPDMVLERLSGPTVAQALASGRLTPASAGALLADLLHRLHTLPPRPGAAPGDRLLHLDLHPENVMLTPRGAVVIDWRNATDGPPDLDLALSALILAQVAADPAHPLAAPADLVLTAFLPTAHGDPMRLLDRAVTLRATQLDAAPDTLTAAITHLLGR